MMTPSVNDVLYPTAEDRAVAVASLRAEVIGLRRAINAGLLTASYDGKSVSYGDFSEMKMRLNFAEAQLMSLAAPGYRRPTAGFAVFRRGNG
jgi:hypothetical protein